MIKLLRNRFVLNTRLNFRFFLRFKVLVLRAGRRSWSLFSSLWIILLGSLSNNSWRRSEVYLGLIQPMSHCMSKRERWCALLAFVLLQSRWEGMWGRPSWETGHACFVLKNCSNSRISRPDRLSYVTVIIYTNGELCVY